MRAYTNTEELAAEVRAALDVIEPLAKAAGEQGEAAYAWLETFAAISLRVIAKTNPSKVRDCTRAEWIKALMEKKPQLEKELTK